MKHAVIVAHPNEQSFTMTVANAYCDAVRANGSEATQRDLYRMNFAPSLAASEVPKAGGFAPGPDVLAERRILSDVDVFAFVYPFWMNAQPAMMKGYIDRIFGMGFAYGPSRSGNVPLLAPRKMISLTSSGGPTDWLVKTGAWDAVRKLFDEHFATVCGLELVDHIHFGGGVPGIRADAVDRHLEDVRAAVAKHF